MTIEEYYKGFEEAVKNNIEESLRNTHSYFTSLTKNREFVEEYDKWIDILKNRHETFIFKNACRAYQESLGNMLMGLYQPAFMGLRYFLERTLMGVYLSSSEIEIKTWKLGGRDTYWAELIGEEGEDRSKNNASDDKNVNKGLFSLKFTRAFFPELESVYKTHRSVTKNVYRECSEFVHGNPSVLNQVGFTMVYNEELVQKWNDCADTIARCILYAFFMRYWKELSDTDKINLVDRIKDEFGASDVIKNYI